MPADFDKCVSDGGRVVTKSLKDNKYIHICYDKEGNPHSGELKTKEDATFIISRAKEVIKLIRELLSKGKGL